MDVLPIVTGEAEARHDYNEAGPPNCFICEGSVLVNEARPMERRDTRENRCQDNIRRDNAIINPRVSIIGQNNAVKYTEDAECDKNNPVKNRLE